MRSGLALSALLLLAMPVNAGCAGKNFIRPQIGMLVTGKTTRAEVIGAVGAPELDSVIIKNGRKISVMTYVYAAAVAHSLHQGTIPARVIELGFYDDLLVSQLFESSFKDDGSDFDESKVSAMVIGKTNQADVRQLLGRPGGETVFPLVPEGKSAWTYAYSHFRNVKDLKTRTYRKALTVRYDAAGIVEDYELRVSGEKFP
jgi:outer membrane protein assembly factor BamE (lipoprotein component of BamABCDE complex)